MNEQALLPFVAISVLAAPLAAQTIDFPNSTLASPPQIAFPFYTPGGGSSGQTVRTQWLCADTFLAAHSLAPGLVTRIGLSLAGQAIYSRFELRAGATTATTLGPDWAINLPDQRLQRDLSNTLLVGGGTAAAPVNQWVEFDLDQPFAWQPGQGIVVDIIAHIAAPGVYLGSTSGAGVPRAVNFAYAPGALATGFTGNGCAFRLVFAPPDLVPFGTGCAAPGAPAPTLASLGTATPGGAIVVLAQQTLVNTVGGFLFGLSRNVSSLGPLPLDLGGGCALLVAPDVFTPTSITPTGGFGGAGTTLAIPNDPLLTGAVVYTQWAQFDGASPAAVPLTFSHGGIVVVL
ncbi:MAG: hypothetical protein WAT39_02130 [Planctomycetota bacterium]